jgi:hypothetical protein
MAQGHQFPPNGKWSERDWGIANATARRLFNPSKPINEERLFSGRIKEVSDVEYNL